MAAYVNHQQLKRAEQKSFVHSRNRSVGFRIISWNYVDPIAPKKTPKIKDQEENSEDIND